MQPKPKFEVVEEVGHESDGLWVDMYGPTTEVRSQQCPKGKLLNVTVNCRQS